MPMWRRSPTDLSASMHAVAHGCIVSTPASSLAISGNHGVCFAKNGWISLSALHNVFFSRDYHAEFDDIFRPATRLPNEPTVYVCAQDRGGGAAPSRRGEERLLVLGNAPANGRPAFLTILRRWHDARNSEHSPRRWSGADFKFAAAGMTQVHNAGGFQQIIPGDGRSPVRPQLTRMDRVVSASGSANQDTGTVSGGGSTHPGPGVPMAALSGRSAALSLLADLTSQGWSTPTAMRGGTSTR